MDANFRTSGKGGLSDGPQICKMAMGIGDRFVCSSDGGSSISSILFRTFLLLFPIDKPDSDSCCYIDSLADTNSPDGTFPRVPIIIYSKRTEYHIIQNGSFSRCQHRRFASNTFATNNGLCDYLCSLGTYKKNITSRGMDTIESKVVMKVTSVIMVVSFPYFRQRMVP